MNDTQATLEGFEAIRREILDHIARGGDFPRPRRTRTKLDLQRGADWEPEWLEVYILFNCYNRAIPARTHGALSRLRKSRYQTGEQHKFGILMQQVTDMLKPDFITPHGYNRTFSELDSEAILASMGAIVAPLSELGYPIFLYAGALLGYQREGALIGHDDDIDVGVYLGDLEDQEVPHRWFAYKRALANASLLTEAEKGAGGISFKLKTSLPVEVDLFPAWTHQGKISVYPYSFHQLAESAILPLRDFGQDPLMLPADPEALLSQSYGKNWRVPDPLFHLNWPKKKKLFNVLSQHDYCLHGPERAG